MLATSNDSSHLSSMYGQPRLSPDGSHVLFLRLDPEKLKLSLWVVGTDGSEERMLASDEYITPEVWDPTGRLIAYQVLNEGEQWPKHLRVVSITDGATHEIEGFSELGNATLQAWSQDGTWIGVKESVGRWELWVNRDILGSER